MIQSILDEIYNIFFALTGCDQGCEQSTIDVSGDNPVYVYKDENYVDEGLVYPPVNLDTRQFNSYDNRPKEDFDQLVTTESNVDTSTPGEYKVKYIFKNNLDCVKEAERKVIVVNNDAPTLLLNAFDGGVGDEVVTVRRGSTYEDPGARAYDDSLLLGGPDAAESQARFNALQAKIVTVSNVDTSKVGTYTVTYNVSDFTGIAAEQLTRTVRVVRGKDEPVITLRDPSSVTIEVGSTYYDAGATASDTNDGDLTDKIKRSFVRVEDGLPVELPDGGLTHTMLLSSTKPPAKMVSEVGEYQITFDVSNSIGFSAQQVIRTVLVKDTLAPFITVLGFNSLMIAKDSSYNDAGATASDTYDGDLTEKIERSLVRVNPAGKVTDVKFINTSEVGTYTITYSVEDAAGNKSKKSRTVTVFGGA